MGDEIESAAWLETKPTTIIITLRYLSKTCDVFKNVIAAVSLHYPVLTSYVIET